MKNRSTLCYKEASEARVSDVWDSPARADCAPERQWRPQGIFSPEVGHKFNSTPISKKINVTLTSNCSFIKNSQKQEVGASSPPRSRGTPPRAPTWEPCPEGGRWAPVPLLTLRSPLCSHLPPPPDPVCPHTKFCRAHVATCRGHSRRAPRPRCREGVWRECCKKLSQPHGRGDNNFFSPRFGIQQRNLKNEKGTRAWVSVCALSRAPQ